MELLIKAGGDVNLVCRYSDTALSLAISSRNLEKVKLLIDNGADVNVRVKQRKGTASLLALAKKKGNQDIIDLLIKAGAKE